jgi:hypothetical protein
LQLYLNYSGSLLPRAATLVGTAATLVGKALEGGLFWLAQGLSL